MTTIGIVSTDIKQVIIVSVRDMLRKTFRYIQSYKS